MIAHKLGAIGGAALGFLDESDEWSGALLSLNYKIYERRSALPSPRKIRALLHSHSLPNIRLPLIFPLIEKMRIFSCSIYILLSHWTASFCIVVIVFAKNTFMTQNFQKTANFQKKKTKIARS